MSFSLSLHFFAGVESGEQCLLNSKVLSCFSGVIMSIRSFFLYQNRIALDNNNQSSPLCCPFYHFCIGNMELSDIIFLM